MNPRPASGFTLFEVLVALLILSLISVMTQQALGNLLSTSERSRERLAELEQLGVSFEWLDVSFRSAIARPYRDAQAQTQPGFWGDAQQMSMVRLYAHRDSQRLLVSCREQRLEVATFEPLDQAPETSAVRTETLAQGLEQCRFAYIDHSGRRQDFWPPSGITGLPKALVVELNSQRFGQLERWFLRP